MICLSYNAEKGHSSSTSSALVEVACSDHHVILLPASPTKLCFSV